MGRLRVRRRGADAAAAAASEEATEAAEKDADTRARAERDAKREADRVKAIEARAAEQAKDAQRVAAIAEKKATLVASEKGNDTFAYDVVGDSPLYPYGYDFESDDLLFSSMLSISCEALYDVGAALAPGDVAAIRRANAADEELYASEDLCADTLELQSSVPNGGALTEDAIFRGVGESYQAAAKVRCSTLPIARKFLKLLRYLQQCDHGKTAPETLS